MTEIKIHHDVEVQLIDFMGDDFSIAQAARVSTLGANETFDGQKDKGLINYLMKERHGSPFEHVVFKFYVAAPIFVFREFHRHRIASYNEMSGRYTTLPPDFYIPGDDRPLVNVGTSARPEFAEGSAQQRVELSEEMFEVYDRAWKGYQHLLNLGVANEVARMVLPVGIFSQMYVTMNLRGIFNFLSLRTHRSDARHISRPQREIEMVAEKIEIKVADICPIAWEAFQKNGRVAP